MRPLTIGAVALGTAALLGGGVAYASAQSTTGTVTVSACVASGKFIDVTDGTPIACPAGDTAVSWSGTGTVAPPPAPKAPVVTGAAASSLTATGATLNGKVNPEGSATTYQFQYGTSTSYGTDIPVTSASVGSGTTAVAETADLTGLSASTGYDYRLVATSTVGTTDGPNETFTTPAASTGTACVINLNGACPANGTYTDPANFVSENSSMQGTYVDDQGLTDNSHPAPVSTETVYGPEDWTNAVSVDNTGDGAVDAYPATVNSLYSTGGAPNYDTTPSPLTDYTDLTSSFATSMPASGDDAEAAYDVWTDPMTGESNVGWNEETMIWTDATPSRLDITSTSGPCGYLGNPLESNVSFGGTNGVPVESWDLCVNGTPGAANAVNDDTEYIWVPAGAQETSGSVDIQAMIQNEITKGYLPSDIGYTQINYGFELCGTTGTQDFSVSKLTLTEYPSS